MSPAFVVLAHQGGWDEVLLIGAPIVVIMAILFVAKRRVDRQVATNQADDPPGPTAAES